MPSATPRRLNPLYLACRTACKRFSVPLLSAMAMLCAATITAEAATRQQWDCHPAGDGSHWVCGEIEVPGSPYRRPERTVRPEPQQDGIPSVATPLNLDWVERDKLTAQQYEQVRSGCCGAYIEPPRTYPESDLPPEKATLEVGAATSQILQDNIALLQGDVHVTQGRRQIRSDDARVDRDTREIELTNNVIYREPGLLMLSDRAHADIDRDSVTTNNATFVMHDSGVRGTASRLQRDDDGMIYVNDATYTTCQPGNNAWRLKSAELDLDTAAGWGTGRHVRLELKDVPVIYLPWVRFPLDDRRTTGVLFPTWEISETNGLDVAVPIYLNLAPNYDATITPRYLSERGLMLELEARHMSLRTSTVFSGGYLREDAGGARDEDIDPNTGLARYEDDDRSIVRLRHNGGMGAAWSTRADYTRVSDNDFFRDLDAATLEVSSQTHLLQMAGAGYQLGSWNFDLEARKYQTIIDSSLEQFRPPKQYQMMPRVSANGRYRFGGIATTLNHQLTHFENDDSSRVTGQRARIDYGAEWTRNWMWGFFSPAVKLKHISYDLDRPSGDMRDSTPGVTVPVAMIDSGIFLERPTSLIGNHTQTLEPRLFYLYSETKDQSELPEFDTSLSTFSYQQLFRDDRFSGGDRIGDAHQITIGITTRLLDQSNGVERFRASIGQAFYLDKREVSLDLHPDILRDPDWQPSSGNENHNRYLYQQYDELRRNRSDYAAEAALRLGNFWRLQTDILWDARDDKINKTGASLRYRDDNDRILNFGYRYNRELPVTINNIVRNRDIEQTEFSTFWPLADSNFSLIGRWQHDLTNNRELETYAGLEYNSCCWTIAVIARRWIDRDDARLIPDDDLEYDQGIFFQIQLKGLAGLGDTMESLLSEGIYGYQPRRR